MATLSLEDRKRIKQQLDSIQERLNAIKAARNSSTSIPSNLNAAQIGGASGVGFEGEDNQKVISEQTEATIESGGSRSQVGDRVSTAQAQRLVGGYGLDGLVNPANFAGLTYGEAAARARAEQQKRTGQVSQNTSFAFNPEILKSTQRAIDKFGFALNDVTNDPFEPKEFKDEEVGNLIEVTGKQIGQLFDSPDQLYQAYNTNQQFKETLDKFIAKGGSLDSVSKSIVAPSQQTELQTLQQTLGNEQNIQTPSEYLASLRNPQADPRAEAMALEELPPGS